MNVSFVGHIGRDAQLYTDQNTGREYVRFSVADNAPLRYSKDAKPIWVTCFLHGKNEGRLPYLKAGARVYISGMGKPTAYTNQQGVVVSEMQVNVLHIEFCSDKPAGSQQGAPYAQQQAPQAQQYVGGGTYPQQHQSQPYSAPQQPQRPQQAPTYPQQSSGAPKPIGGDDDLPF